MYKVIIVSNQTKEVEKLLTEGWQVVGAYNYSKGLLFILHK